MSCLHLLHSHSPSLQLRKLLSLFLFHPLHNHLFYQLQAQNHTQIRNLPNIDCLLLLLQTISVRIPRRTSLLLPYLYPLHQNVPKSLQPSPPPRTRTQIQRDLNPLINLVNLSSHPHLHLPLPLLLYQFPHLPFHQSQTDPQRFVSRLLRGTFQLLKLLLLYLGSPPRGMVRVLLLLLLLVQTLSLRIMTRKIRVKEGV